MTETSFERVFIDGTAELLPNFTLEKLMYDNFEKIGVVQTMKNEPSQRASKSVPTAERGFRNRSHRGS